MVARRITAGQALHSPDSGEYVTYCASATPRELAKIDAAVAKLKSAGVRKMNRSWLIRIGIDHIDLDLLIALLLSP